MTGHKVRLPSGTNIKNGKLSKAPARMSVSARIKQRKSKRVRVAKKAP